jgi:hypothetical protein
MSGKWDIKLEDGLPLYLERWAGPVPPWLTNTVFVEFAWFPDNRYRPFKDDNGNDYELRIGKCVGLEQVLDGNITEIFWNLWNAWYTV